MIKLIIGEKGSGKSKRMIDLANSMLESSKGELVFLDDDSRSMYDIKRDIRFVNLTEIDVKGRDSLIGFLKGLCSGNSDIESIFIDGLLKLIDKSELIDMLDLLDKLSLSMEVDLYLCFCSTEEAIPKDKGYEIL